MKYPVYKHGTTYECSIGIPITKISMITNSGGIFEISTPLTVNDFMLLWNSKNNILKIPTSKESYAFIRKRRIDCFDVKPIKFNA